MTKRGKIPLVVYLHGTGECGEKMSLMGYPEYIADGKNYNLCNIIIDINYLNISLLFHLKIIAIQKFTKIFHVSMS